MGTLVQGTGAQSSGSVTSVGKAYTSSVTAGNTLVCVAVSSTKAIGLSDITDSQINTWTRRVLQDPGAGKEKVAIFTAIAGSTGINSVTFQPAAGADFISIAIGEISGELNPVTIDITGTGTAVNTGTLATTGLTTTTNGCVVGGFTHSGSVNQTITENGSPTQIYQNTNTANMPIDASFKNTVAGANNPSWTLNSNASQLDAAAIGLQDSGGAASTANVGVIQNPGQRVVGGWT